MGLTPSFLVDSLHSPNGLLAAVDLPSAIFAALRFLTVCCGALRVKSPAAARFEVARIPFRQYRSDSMVQLADIQKQANELSEEDRQGLVAFLLHGLTDGPIGADDEEVERRDIEMDSGEVMPISHAEFLEQVGRQ